MQRELNDNAIFIPIIININKNNHCLFIDPTLCI